MQTTDISNELATIISQLNEEGKTPTTALIKARLGHAVPIPAIIAALKSWKATKHVPKMEIVDQTSDDPAQRIAALESRITQLEARLSRLEQQSEVTRS